MVKCIVNYSECTDFPLENLPYGVFSSRDNPTKRIGVAIGDCILDISKINHLFDGSYLKNKKEILQKATLNDFMSLGPDSWREARARIQELLSTETVSHDPKAHEATLGALVKASDCTMHLPADIGDYTDFYCSRGHANNMGLLFRGKENDLPPNCSNIYYEDKFGTEGPTDHSRNFGTAALQRNKIMGELIDEPPVYGPSRLLDIELEMAFFVGPGNRLGQPIPIDRAQDHIFGIVLMNDWSARDIQKWEYFPLGPFLGKSFSTSISPWVVTMDALKPFLVPNVPQDPIPFPHLRDPGSFNYDINLEVLYKTDKMSQPKAISKPNFGKHLYWNLKQMLTHHTSNGCNARPGDLMGTGTISGTEKSEFGSLLELSWKGARPIELENGEKRTFLQDGDEVTLRAFCQGKGYRVGFGECVGKILPAISTT